MITFLPKQYEVEARNLDSDDVSRNRATVDISVRLNIGEGTARAIIDARRSGAISYTENHRYFKERRGEETLHEYVERIERNAFYNGTIRLEKIKPSAKISGEENEPEEALRRYEENFQMLELLLEELSERDREVIKKIFLENRSPKEVALEIKRCKFLVYKVIEKSFRIMRERMNDFGYSLRRGFED